jgi:hypothetical protein
LAQIRTELQRLTEAIIAGGSLSTLTQAMKDREHRRAQLEHELGGLDELAQVSPIDAADLAREFAGPDPHESLQRGVGVSTSRTVA